MFHTMLTLLKYLQSWNRGSKSRKTEQRGGNPQAGAEGWFQNTSSHHGECPTWMGVDGKASEQFSVSWDCWHACRLGLKMGSFGFGVWGKNTDTDSTNERLQLSSLPGCSSSQEVLCNLPPSCLWNPLFFHTSQDPPTVLHGVKGTVYHKLLLSLSPN